MMGLEGLTDVEVILLVLAAFYVSEAFGWFRGGSAWFVSVAGGACRIIRSALLTGNDLAGPIFLELLPSGRSFLARSWPVSISPTGLYSFSAASLSPGGRQDQPARYVPFVEVDTIEARGDEVEINNKTFVSAASHSHARFIAENLRRIAHVSPETRGSEIEAFLDVMTDEKAVKDRVAEIDSKSSTLKTTSFLLFVLVFVLAPFGYYEFRLHPSSTRLLVAFLLSFFFLWIFNVFSFARVARSIEPDDRLHRRKQVLTMALSPVAAMRAWSHLPRHALLNFHPLAIAVAVCNEDMARNLAGDLLRDALHPLPPSCPDDTPAHLETEAWFRERLAEAFFRLAQRSGYDPERMLTAPERESASRSYCPRCHDQYEVTSGTCTSCEGLGLISFDGEVSTASSTSAPGSLDPGQV
ncbi:hypothetical protein [Singulisphaera sp. PoT]|uniref:hypothetical protein n=1 Tax=Singulisphaera sp. PoT TaxID=3411797 RepID=UPI003BF57971